MLLSAMRLAFSVLFSFLLCFGIVSARPIAAGSTFLSIPLVSPSRNVSHDAADYVHGSITQQQHINRALKRFALTTGREPPSEDELVSNIYERITRLPARHLKRYDIQKITQTMDDRYSCEHPQSFGTHPRAHERRSDDTASNTNSTLGGPSIRNIGLSIESYDYGYMATVKMGSPGRNFNLLIDSGSADLWVGSEGCMGDDGGSCGNHTFLGARSSTTFNESKEDWAIGYVSGSVSGYLVQDDVTIGGLKLKAHTFGVAINESIDFTSDAIPFDGLLGLGKEAISQQRVPTLLQSLYQATLIPAPIVSYKLPRLADGYNDGEMTLGGMDPKHFNRKTLVTKKNINKFGFWGVNVDAVQVGTQNMNWSNRTIVLDTGTTLMVAPQHDVDAIHSKIPGARFDGSGWIVPCNMTTSIALTIGGQKFPMDPRDIAFYPVEYESPECMSGIAAGGVGPFYLDNEWLVGDVFLKSVYFSTDENQDTISIARPIA
ncbi:putative aspartic-type endopeptidase CTSD [Psilocybe cubensis]|uniref:Aspartic-type endopeptidase CTSD n=2 Tax=Psilocybe cubensis TaxID=181762 RepID=A0ACB8H1C8_PSICU|nr:putative aspartic-type endopeptidase CTSD [Psilocybe cubensis]KAH9481636.1 putative aspartic-type endopeptidase CTSD [Psilocybe cubensis]